MAVHEKYITKDDIKAIKNIIKAAEKGNESEFRMFSSAARNVAEKVLRICFADYADDNFFDVIDRNLSSSTYKKFQNQFHFVRKNLNKGTHEHNTGVDLTHEDMVKIAVALRDCTTGLILQELNQDMKIPEVKIPTDEIFQKSARLQQKKDKKQKKELRKAIKADVSIVKDSKCESKIVKHERKSIDAPNYKASVIYLFNLSIEKNNSKVRFNEDMISLGVEKINFVKLKRDLLSYLENYHPDIDCGEFDFSRISIGHRRPSDILGGMAVEVRGKYRNFLYIDPLNEDLRSVKFDTIEIPSSKEKLKSLYLITMFKVSGNSERVISHIYDIATKIETRNKKIFEVAETFKVAVTFND